MKEKVSQQNIILSSNFEPLLVCDFSLLKDIDLSVKGLKKKKLSIPQKKSKVDYFDDFYYSNIIYSIIYFTVNE